jgi:hypothetical protein
MSLTLVLILMFVLTIISVGCKYKLVSGITASIALSLLIWVSIATSSYNSASYIDDGVFDVQTYIHKEDHNYAKQYVYVGDKIIDIRKEFNIYFDKPAKVHVYHKPSSSCGIEFHNNLWYIRVQE